MTTMIVHFNDMRLHIVDIDDYSIEGSFDPDAACDLEYYGFRDTSFTVETIDEPFFDVYLPLTDEERDQIVAANEDKILLLVQDQIDKGEM
ncbi:MAG: hypothetical protein [Caudoviricetes sp.]|nr:MAG: hypothetical protein [Caudoviricetes sp.]